MSAADPQPQTALLLTEDEWEMLGRIAQSYLESDNSWAEQDEDDEAMEIRACRVLAHRLFEASAR